MPNLDKIFNKFYPQSQTGSKGKFLLNMAWTVEILVAIIGICIAIIVIINAQGIENVDELSGRSLRLNDITFGGIFFIVAIVELTKIPLATAVYYSVRLYWKIIFLVGLLLVNVSTFETIVTGFERINRERTKIVDKKIVKYHSINTQLEQLEDNTNIKQFDGEINELRKQRSEINKQISEINVSGQKRIQDIKDSGTNTSAIDELRKQIDTLNSDITDLRNQNVELTGQIDGKFFNSNKKTITNSIESNKLTINNYEIEKRDKESKLSSLINAQGKSSSGAIEIENSEIQSKTKPLKDELEIIAKNIAALEGNKTQYNLDDEEKIKRIKKLEAERLELISNGEGTGIDDLAPDSQVYRVATWLKDWFIIDYNNEINEINEQIFQLEKQKVKSITERGWFDKLFSVFNKNSRLDNEAIDRQISNLNTKIIEFEKKAIKAETKVSDSVYADIPSGALAAAFWLWFGVLSFIISVTGTMLAFASLVLLDPRLHIIRNKRTANWKGLGTRISKFFVLINKYIWGKIKRFRDPNIKIVEKEVEKIVEKKVEVEKFVGEKIVYEKVEVPKEVIRKEIVYVPLPTDDNELLKKGPFTAPDYDKKK
ncbi:hypothetical protein IDG53_00475 [Pelagibacterales bacterium SAG-MED11]|nr:hypothetical protein [Pelagibacterales bacterium SAG-MED11]